MRYEITDDFCANIFYTDDAKAPLVIQPFNPHGGPWNSADEAEEWAAAFVAERIAEQEAANANLTGKTGLPDDAVLPVEEEPIA